MYTIRFIKPAANDVKSLPKNVRNSLRGELEKIVSANPVDCSEELTGPLSGFRSYHFGEYRVVYKISSGHNLVVIIGIGKKNADHSAVIYKSLESMAKAGKLAGTVLENLRMLGAPS